MSERALSVAGVGAAFFAIASVVLFGVVIGFDPSVGAETFARIARTAPDEVGFIRWGAITDMLGYYLLPAGIVVAVRDRIPWPNATVRDVATSAFVVYATIGSIGTAILAAAVPSLVESGADGQLTLRSLLLVVEGLWHWLEPIPFAVWAWGMAFAFRGRSTMWSLVFGALALGGILVWLGRVLGLDALLIAGLGLLLGPFPFVFAAVAAWAPARESRSTPTNSGRQA